MPTSHIHTKLKKSHLTILGSSCHFFFRVTVHLILFHSVCSVLRSLIESFRNGDINLSCYRDLYYFHRITILFSFACQRCLFLLLCSMRPNVEKAITDVVHCITLFLVLTTWTISRSLGWTLKIWKFTTRLTGFSHLLVRIPVDTYALLFCRPSRYVCIHIHLYVCIVVRFQILLFGHSHLRYVSELDRLDCKDT